MGFGFSFSLSPQGTTTPPAPPTAAPTNTTPPAISGTAQSGSTLTTTFGVWTQSPDGYAYQWKAAGTNISGATARTYLLTDAEVGKTITVTVTATNSFGSASSTSTATTAVTAKPITEKPAPTVAPAITGNTLVGSTLMTSNGTWQNSPTGYSYQWFRNGTALSGATANVFALLAQDYGATFYARVTATNVVGSTDAFTQSVGPVTQNAPTATVAPSISGLPQVDAVLTANLGTWTSDPTLTVQWYSDGFEINDATDTTYTVQASDKDTMLSIVVTAVNLGGTTTATSAEIGPITKASFNYKIVAEGDSITAGSLSSDPDTKAYPIVALAGLPAGNTYELANVSVSGAFAQEIADDYDTRVGAQYDPTKDVNILTLMAGANDRTYEWNDHQIYINLRRTLNKAKKQGFQRRLIGTILATDEGDAPQRSWDVSDVQFNTWVKNYWSSDLDADGLFDFSADPRFATAAATHNTTYYQDDKTHLTDLGYSVLASIYEPVLEAALGPAPTRATLPATWFLPDCSRELSLKDGDRTAYWDHEGFTNACVRGAIGKETGKWYFETLHKVDNTTTGVGLMNIDFAVNLEANWNDPGQDPDTIGYISNDSYIRYNGNNVAFMGGKILDGDVVAVAFDADTRRMWIRKNNGPWNGGAAEGSDPFDPATGIGGIDLSPLGTGKLYPLGFIFNSGSEITARFSGGQTTLPIPSGFLMIAS